jgi:endoglucanase
MTGRIGQRMQNCRRSLILASSGLILLLGAIACSSSSSANGAGGSGGFVSTGGATGGGVPATGGGAPSTGSGTGGLAGPAGTGGSGTGTTGGAVNPNGASGAGSSSGGSSAGGTVSSSGAPATGGTGTSGGAGLGGTGSGSGGLVGGSGTVGGGGSAVGGSGPEPFTFGVPPAAAARFKKGINLGNRLEAPNEGDWGGVIQAEDFPFIAKRGFDHVRIPIRFSGHALAAAPYTIDAAFFSRVDTVVDQATAANLAVILDMHAYDELAKDVAAHRERFVALWAQIAARYQSRPDTVAFELFNEPYGQLDTTWNDVMLPAIQAIRVTNPRRLLVIDSVFWADPTKLSVLTLPNDANLLTSIHLYEPKLFTFQGQDWMGEAYLTTGIVFPGPPATPVTPVQAAKDTAWANEWFTNYNTKPADTNPSGPATIAAQIALITSYRQSQGRTVYNGEWGPQDGGAMDSRARLVTAVRQACEAAGIGWAIWEDPEHMSLFDSRAGTWETAIIDALLPP